VGQATISRDIQNLKVQARKFVYDLAKSELAYSYKLCIDGIEEVKRKAWFIFNNELQNPKDKLLALKIIAEANESLVILSMYTLKRFEHKLVKYPFNRQT
jgi:transcriptional antiterminator